MTTVLIGDSNLSYDEAKLYFAEIDRWAQEYCRSYGGYRVQDVADFSYVNDLIAAYVFADEQDVTLFSLRWC